MPTPAIHAIDSRRQYWQRNAGLWALALLMCLFCLIIISEMGFRRGFDRIYLTAKSQVENELKMQTQILESHLEKYRLLPVIMAHQSQFINDTSMFNEQYIVNWLQQLTYLTGSYDVLLLNANGDIRYTAHHLNPIRKALQKTDLIKAPLQARLGRGYLLLDDKMPVYGFSALVDRPEQGPLILMFLVNLAPVMESWALSSATVIASDTEKTTVLASNIDLIGQNDSAAALRNHPDYAPAQKDLLTMDWSIEAFQKIDRGSITQQSVLFSLLVCLTIFTSFMLYIRRREMQVKQILRDRLYAQELERQITFRTAELVSANKYLTEEINDRRRAEQQLETKQQELIHSAKLATIGQMSTTLSHEYNQPLATIRTYAENAIRFLQRDRIEPVEENLQRILQQADRLGDLSRTLLSFAGKPDRPVAAVNLSASVNEAIMLAQAKLKKYSIGIEQTVPESLQLKGHTVQVSQVILNLLTNAIDALKEVSPREGFIRIRATQQDGTICLSVEDNGPGIEKTIQASLFDPFVTTKSSGKGLGLGLSIIRDIITEHQGRIQVSDSALGGACFTVLWPVWKYTDD
ncbi:MAG: ATP-binding protein [Reinekea sp.]